MTTDETVTPDNTATTGKTATTDKRDKKTPMPEVVDRMVGEITDEVGTVHNDTGAGKARWRSSLLVPIVLAVATVLFCGAATTFALKWSEQRAATVVGNTALVDNASTAQVQGQVSNAINNTFSYDYNDVGKTERAARNLLTGAAVCQYTALFRVIQQRAPNWKLVLTTHVAASGVQVLSGDTARVLLVVDQSDRRGSTTRPVQSQGALAVNAVRKGDGWKISGIDTFDGTTDTSGCH